MLTLLVTVLATAYFVVPDLLTRFVFSFYFVRKASTGTRSEEILRAAFWATVPLAIAWCTRHIGWWSVPSGTLSSAQTVFASLYSDRFFEQNPSAFYTAFQAFATFNIRLLVRTYVIVVAGAASFGWFALQLGVLRNWLKSWPRLRRCLHWIFVPRISEWDVALSPMLVHARKELTVRIDVQTKNEILYRGIVFEKRISADGNLATLILQDAERMVRDDYRRDRTFYEENKSSSPNLVKPKTDDYWRKIPGEMFLLNGSEIATVNIRHVRPIAVIDPQKDTDLLKAFGELVEELSNISQKMQGKTHGSS